MPIVLTFASRKFIFVRMKRRAALCPAPARKPGTVQALHRGLQILDVLADRGSLPLAEVARTVGLHVSTTHHLIKTLESLGYVAQARDRTYGVGSHLLYT